MDDDIIESFTYYFSDYQGYNHNIYRILSFGQQQLRYSDSLVWLILGYIQKYQFYNWDEIKLNEDVGFLEDSLKDVLDENEKFSIENNILTIDSSNFEFETVKMIMFLLGFKITKINNKENHLYKIYFEKDDK